MKKILFFYTLAIAAILTSCKNDEITISKPVNFTVNPSSVVTPFSAGEINAGDLESFHQDCKLIVELYIYNAEGDLVKKFSESFNNYAVQMKSSLFLPSGDYTAVAITHVDDLVDDIHYWKIEGIEKLEGLRIIDGGYVGGQNKVLGVSTYNFSVDKYTEDISINVQPAGSLLTVFYYNFKALSSYDVEGYYLFGNKTMDYLEFDRSGYTNVVANNHGGSYDWLLDYLDMSYYSSSSATNIYSYEFTLPMTNIGLQYYIKIGDTYYSVGSGTLTTSAGGCYYANLYLSSNVDEITTSFGQTRSSDTRSLSIEDMSFKMKYDKPVRNNIVTGQTLYVKDLLK